jgi:hypothetical protein
MAQLYTTGPAHIFLSDKTGYVSPSSALYLGTAEESPAIQIEPLYEPVVNTLGGKTPFDVSYQGEMAKTAVTLNRFNEDTYRVLVANRPSPLGTRGLNGPLDVGSLILTEGLYLTFWMTFPFVSKAVMAAGNMPLGYRFPATIPAGPDELAPLGTVPRKLRLLFWHLRLWDVSTGQFLLYDHNVLGLPTIN